MLIPAKTDLTSTLPAAEFNQILTEAQTNLITTSGQTPSAVTLDQVGTAVASYAAQGGVFGIDSGAADAYVFTQVSPFKAPFALKNGMTIKFRPGNANTGACTVNACGFGVKDIKQGDGTTNPVANSLNTSTDINLRYDGTSWLITGSSVQATETVAGIAEIATQAETIAGTASKIVDPAKLLALYGASLLSAGEMSIQLPVKNSTSFSTAIIKAGTYGNTSSGTFNFATAFPNQCVAVNLTATNGSNEDIITAKSVSSFSWDNAGSDTPNGYWIAIGY